MPTVLQFRFPAGGYHATPWGHHVNEGLVEWPPSPWRLLRALLATGYAKCGWQPDAPPTVAVSLIEHLARALPRFNLPDVAPGHTRHYVQAAGKKPLILDAFLRVEPTGVVEIVWDLDLPAVEQALLAELALLLGYLGRAESWVESRLVPMPTLPANCLPAGDDAGPPGPGWEAVALLCAVSAADYHRWFEAQTAPIHAAHAPPPGKKPTKAIEKKLQRALAPYPRDLLAALSAETGWLQGHGWSAAPGSKAVRYWRRADALEPAPLIVSSSAMPPEPAPRFALLTVNTPSRNRSALPSVARVFPQGRLLHKALAADHSRDDPALTRVLLGRDAGHAARDAHAHAHLLHLDLDGDGRLDHVLVWAPAGLSPKALDALRIVRRTWMKGGVGELQVAFAGAGSADLLRSAEGRGLALARTLGPAGGACTWVSATAYVAPRFMKSRGKDSLEGQIGYELALRGLPSARVTRLDLREAPRDRLRHFVLHADRHQPPVPVPHALRLDFAEPVEGPICLGFGSHAGLGRFEVG